MAMDGYTNLAYDYPLLGAFWTTMWVFLWVLWFILLFRIIGDILRDDSLSGWAKTGWLVFAIVFPFLGVFVYVFARGRGMGVREQKHVRTQQEAIDQYVRETAAGAGGTNQVAELSKLSEIKARGDLSDEEFRRAKEKILH
jgi:signal transduction histidine kinase